MKQKKLPLRKCVITQEMLPKNDLIRVVRTPEGDVVIDTTGKLNGRGAYLSRDVDVIRLAEKKRTLDHHLKVKTSETLYEQLEQAVTGAES
ncbi:YlxR family protein [Exiguobacterium sp. SH3S2]|uniref:RNase P modulator RnpM n=1 Tax=unclassified Exiguobacterium TaxID=2644629 RepID=UPI0008779D22|nr:MULTISPECIES: YlxR family protein [Exiguobacterium]OGX77921.1 RNA-binding protein [Exiguobacterium sp. SH31]TCI27400.1 YlxR family protein [Exiguobacterium sp. SH5S4]TCI37317.1 YlxR family protein [Exiguobacterium sp. SH4S7]TCI45447.1 YlxR family protein [Exiguobacterium sp. SH5S32]TCI49277.1 YlxR family protein [Exiguobacterium sp. SH3S3]